MPSGSRSHVFSAVAMLAAVFAFSGCDSDQAEQAVMPPPAVGVIVAEVKPVNPYFEFVGKTQATESVDLRARVVGFLEKRAFHEGGEVAAGDVLFEIEPEAYLASLAQAEADLSAAKASLNRAQVDLKRYKELAKAKNVSQQKVDEADAEVLVQEAAVHTAEAAVQKAQLNVDYTEIKAPIAGRIDLSRYDVGNLVGPDSGVMATINKMDPIKVVFSISETWYLELTDAERIEKHERGDTAADADEEITHVPLLKLPNGKLYVDGADDEPTRGVFDFFDNKVDEKTGTVQIRAVFDNKDGLLLPGTFVTVVIRKKDATESVLIPQAAVLTDQGGGYVLVVNDENKVEIARIETGQRFGANWSVKSGIEAGDRIILSGIQKVRPGMEVEAQVMEAPSDPAAGVNAQGSLPDEAQAEQDAEATADESRAEQAADAPADEPEAEQGAEAATTESE